MASGEWACPVELERVLIEFQSVVGKFVLVAYGESSCDVVVVGLPLLGLICGRKKIGESYCLVLAVGEVLVVELTVEVEVAVLWGEIVAAVAVNGIPCGIAHSVGREAVHIEVVIVSAKGECDEVECVDVEARLDVAIVNVAVVASLVAVENLTATVSEEAAGLAMGA